MTYKQLSKLLPNDEIHYISDCIDTCPELSKYKLSKFILFTGCGGVYHLPTTFNNLMDNSIPFTVDYDPEFQLEYIIV
tara:strand:- start:3190 stop:3423 length:234 start_codon:yes stop_codon:yes gene_type:complete